MDACLAFYPKHFELCPALAQVKATLATAIRKAAMPHPYFKGDNNERYISQIDNYSRHVFIHVSIDSSYVSGLGYWD